MIHFWELPDERNYILLKDSLRHKIIKYLRKKKYAKKKIIYKLEQGKKIKIKIIKEISEILDITLKTFEKSIAWVGSNNSIGIPNPKLPFNFSNREGARFIASIYNDGCLTKGNAKNYGHLLYYNLDKSILKSVIKDCEKIFGVYENTIKISTRKKGTFLAFPSIMRDTVEIIIKSKGSKSESNLDVPSFIFDKTENVLGWIEQAIADESEVKYYPEKYRRSIIWRRSLDVSKVFQHIVKTETPLRRLSPKAQELIQKQNCRVIDAEIKMLNLLGLSYDLYNLGIYTTLNNKIKTRWQISITKRENLLKLREIIRIPSEKKDTKFNNMMKNYHRYKEPLRIKKTVEDICKKKGKITSKELTRAMNYKSVGNAIKWLNKFERNGLITKAQKSVYEGGCYRKPAIFSLTRDK